LNLDFLYLETRKYYGKSGQKSIDPVVFFKRCLVGYLEHIISDRQLINHSSMRMDILYFINYDIEDELPWHSTISRTRQLFPEEVVEEVFTKVLSMCVEKAMVCGHTQTIDSAPIKANASMESIELKVPAEELEEHLQQVRYMSSPDRKSTINKATKEQQIVTANAHQLQGIESRNKKWATDQDQRQGAKRPLSKYTSNKTHYSPTDPDARISVKPGKARKLNYQSQLSEAIDHHVITAIKAYHADKKDNQYLQDIVNRLQPRLQAQGLLWHNCVADTGYSSGENYAFLEQAGLESYIPPHGTYKGGPEGFTYDENKDVFICPKGKEIPFKKIYWEKKNNTKKKEYRASKHICKGCELKTSCLKSSKEKRIDITYYREEYERNIARVKSKRGRYMKKKRQSTVEPVFGTLTQFMGMRKLFTRGIKQANKVMLLSAVAYNLKKYLKFIQKRVESKTQTQVAILSAFTASIMAYFRCSKAFGKRAHI
jgi:transposase